MKDSEINELITKKIRESSPNNVEELVKLVQSETDISKDKIVEAIMKLRDSNKIKLTLTKTKFNSLRSYIFSIQATWFWLEILLSSFSFFLILSLTERNTVLIYLRNLFGLIFVLFLPGYALLKAVLPSKQINIFERMIFSIGISLATIPFVGYILNIIYHIRVIPTTLAILAFITFFSIIGILREYLYQRKNTLIEY